MGDDYLKPGAAGRKQHHPRVGRPGGPCHVVPPRLQVHRRAIAVAAGAATTAVILATTSKDVGLNLGGNPQGVGSWSTAYGSVLTPQQGGVYKGTFLLNTLPAAHLYSSRPVAVASARSPEAESVQKAARMGALLRAACVAADHHYQYQSKHQIVSFLAAAQPAADPVQNVARMGALLHAACITGRASSHILCAMLNSCAVSTVCATTAARTKSESP